MHFLSFFLICSFQMEIGKRMFCNTVFGLLYSIGKFWDRGNSQIFEKATPHYINKVSQTKAIEIILRLPPPLFYLASEKNHSPARLE